MKICVLFPGIGYTTEKPLMYYSGKYASQIGYELVRLKFHDLPSGAKGNKEIMGKAVDLAFDQAMELLRDVEWSQYDEILFIGKSIGTVVAAKYGKALALHASYVFLTPLEETFLYAEPKAGIVCHGTADPWADTAVITKKCEELNVPLYLYEKANHSLETGDVSRDMVIAGDVMKKIMSYLSDL